jgi:DNA-binding PadR family transcriptional regulator
MHRGSVLELAILGLLKEQDLHGYELKKRLGETVGLLARGVSFGSLYPALARLEKAGAVRAVEPPEQGARNPIPLTGSLAGERAALRGRRSGSRRARPRKVYAITPRGEALFDQLLASGPGAADDDRGFALRLAFARHLGRDERLGLLERRRALLVERLARARQAVRAGRSRLDAYAAALVERGAAVTEADISWLDRLIDAERAAPAPPAQPGPEAAAGVQRTGALDPSGPGLAGATSTATLPGPSAGAEHERQPHP